MPSSTTKTWAPVSLWMTARLGASTAFSRRPVSMTTRAKEPGRTTVPAGRGSATVTFTVPVLRSTTGLTSRMWPVIPARLASDSGRTTAGWPGARPATSRSGT